MTTTQIGMIPIDQLTGLQRVRTADRDIPALVESIKRLGIIEPLVVIPDDRGPEHPMLVIAGNRRLAAAKQAGLTEVPCYIRDGITSEARLLEAQLAENTQRDPLTVKEETLAWQALELAGMSTTDIGKAAGRKKTDVDKRLKVMTLPETTRSRVWDGQITLEEADTLAEFADDPEALAWLERYVGTTSFSWKKREWPREKARREAAAKAREQAKVEKAAQKAAEEAAKKAGKPVPKPKPKPAPKQDSWEERQKREKAERDRIEAAAEIARDVRWPWLRDLIQAEVRRKVALPDRLGSIAQMALARIVDNRGGTEVSDDLLAWVGLGGLDVEQVAEKATPMQALVAVLAAAAELDSEFLSAWDWRTQDGPWLYQQLVERFEYPISDEERALAQMVTEATA